MNYLELREAMDHDSNDLKQFAKVLERELSTAIDQLATALSREDAQQVADLKHKLKTSLHLVDATSIRDELTAITEDLRHRRPISPSRKSRLLEMMRQLVQALSREKW
ncbi:Hpt domain-containing protein [Neolewinella xylanilytica]|uniref:Hpt domain-containing protein n=1 Tax=Neolewinella xylanilytica TaxID=1514080 RepID=A0A2S6IAT7_9BACT|nr:Hpt domain-containing protein [Neolewinella xylanilytica]PPK88621.1 Hpt domain-containing protein [Neolewinella xylanilytica]